MEPSESHRRRTRDRLGSSIPAILPSLLQCDFANLQREVEALEGSGIQVLHLDVMDGHFVPNLTYGMPVLASLRKVTSLLIDVHLMISDPITYAPQFAEAGADLVSFHVEAVADPSSLLESLKEQGVLAGLAINPSTPWELIADRLDPCDFALVMSVDAGFGGQGFQPVALERLRAVRAERGADFLLEVDGGVNTRTIESCVHAGADLLVVGSAIFGKSDIASAITDLRAAMETARS